jgi:hypothetical protein
MIEKTRQELQAEASRVDLACMALTEIRKATLGLDTQVMLAEQDKADPEAFKKAAERYNRAWLALDTHPDFLFVVGHLKPVVPPKPKPKKKWWWS